MTCLGCDQFRNSEVDRQTIKSNPHSSLAKGIKVAEWLVEQKVDTVLAREDVKHKGPGYVLANAGVSFRKVEEVSLDQAVSAFLRLIRSEG